MVSGVASSVRRLSLCIRLCETEPRDSWLASFSLLVCDPREGLDGDLG